MFRTESVFRRHIQKRRLSPLCRFSMRSMQHKLVAPSVQLATINYNQLVGKPLSSPNKTTRLPTT